MKSLFLKSLSLILVISLLISGAAFASSQNQSMNAGAFVGSEQGKSFTADIDADGKQEDIIIYKIADTDEYDIDIYKVLMAIYSSEGKFIGEAELFNSYASTFSNCGYYTELFLLPDNRIYVENRYCLEGIATEFKLWKVTEAGVELEEFVEDPCYSDGHGIRYGETYEDIYFTENWDDTSGMIPTLDMIFSEYGLSFGKKPIRISYPGSEEFEQDCYAANLPENSWLFSLDYSDLPVSNGRTDMQTAHIPEEAAFTIITPSNDTVIPAYQPVTVAWTNPGNIVFFDWIIAMNAPAKSGNYIGDRIYDPVGETLSVTIPAENVIPGTVFEASVEGYGDVNGHAAMLIYGEHIRFTVEGDAGSGYFADSYENNASSATVRTTGEVNLRSGPGKDYEKVTSAKSGRDFAYMGETSTDYRGIDWYKIMLDDGRMVWVSSKYSVLQED